MGYVYVKLTVRDKEGRGHSVKLSYKCTSSDTSLGTHQTNREGYAEVGFWHTLEGHTVSVIVGERKIGQIVVSRTAEYELTLP